MKKFLSIVAIITLLNISGVGAEQVALNKIPSLVSIDSIGLMQRSKEGQALAKKIQKEIEDFQVSIKGAQKELVEYQETVSKQAKILSKEALAEKGEKLAKMKKNAERDLSDKEESLKLNIQKQQMVLREKQMSVANKVFEQNGWGLLIDKNAPGVLFVNNSIDKTDEILKAVDEKFDREVAEKLVAGSKTSGKKIIKGA